MRADLEIKVLIIEDDFYIAKIQKKYVESIAGFQAIGIAASRAEAKNMIKAYQPDLILLDVYFPDMSGIELLREIKQYDKQMGVIMITAASEIEMVQEAITIGVFDYIIKPVVFSRFKQSLIEYQQFHLQLFQSRMSEIQLSQQQVDNLIRREQTTVEKEKEKEKEKPLKEWPLLPKGIDRLTLEKVLGVLVTTGVKGLTAEAIAVKVGVSRTTARRYLEYLMTEEKIDADLVYGQIGRPERVYSVRK